MTKDFSPSENHLRNSGLSGIFFKWLACEELKLLSTQHQENLVGTMGH